MPSRTSGTRSAIATRWIKVQRDVWLHKSRTILVVLAIAIGILGAGTVLDAWSLVRRAIAGEFAASNPPSATLHAEGLEADLIGRVRALPQIRDVQARRAVSGRVRTPAGWRSVVLFVADDYAAQRIGIVKPQSGSWPPPHDAIVVEASSVEFAGIAVGQPLEIQLAQGAHFTLPVAGIARDVGLAPGWMEHVVYGFVTPAALAGVGVSGGFDELRIVVADRASVTREGVRGIAHQVRDLLEGAGRTVYQIEVPEPLRHVHAAQIDSLLFTQAAFGVLALLLSAVLVVNLIAAMLASQVREVGVMKALGASSSQVASMYLGLALALGIVACAVAIPAAAMLGRLYARYTADLLNFDIEGYALPIQLLAVQLAIGALLPVVAASVPIRRGCRIPVAAALHESGITAPGRSRRSFGSSSWPRPILFALRNAFRKRQRLALTVLALGIGGAVFVGALNLRAAIRRSVDLLFRSQRFEVVVRFAAPTPPESLDVALASVPGVGAAEAWGAARASLVDSTGRILAAFPISAPPARSVLFVPEIRMGRGLDDTSENTILVNRRLVGDVPQLALDKTVTLALGNHKSTWTVVGIADTGPAAAAYTTRATLARALGDDHVDRAVVQNAQRGPGADLTLVQELRSALALRGYTVQSTHLMSENRRVMEDHLLMVAGFLGAMSQVMIVVGGLALASTMSLAVLERTREIGVLRAIGAPHRSIQALVHTEGLVVGALSWLLALVLSVPVSAGLGIAFSRIMIPVPMRFVPEPTGLLLWLALVVVVTLAACAWPAIRATRVPTTAALAYE